MATSAQAASAANKQSQMPSMGFGIKSIVVRSSAPPPSFKDLETVSKTVPPKAVAPQKSPVEPEPSSFAAAEHDSGYLDHSIYADALAQQDFSDHEHASVFIEDHEPVLPDDIILADAAGHEMVDISAMRSQHQEEAPVVTPTLKLTATPEATAPVVQSAAPSYRPELTEPRMVFVSPAHKLQLQTRAKAPQPIVRYMEHIPKPKAIQLVAKAQPKAVAQESVRLTIAELRERVDSYMDELVHVPRTLI